MDFQRNLASPRFLLLALTLGTVGIFGGCYNPNIGNGAQKCSADGKCPDGFSCFADKHCYKPGSNPSCAPACSGATPMCDKMTLKCVGCLVDKDCPEGRVCKGQACVAGCSAMHPGCGADAGRCDVDMGQCRGCNADAECTDGATPKCDKATGLCVPCLPSDDKCTDGKYCTGKDGQYACVDGCANDAACVKLAMMAGSDGGAGKAVTCCGNRCVDLSGDATNCGTCAKACGGGQACCNSLCVDPSMDVTNCGGCGTVCAPRNVGQATCISGSCGFDKCTPGFGDCDGSGGNGCETSLAGDVNNCGACKKVCMAPANAQVLCMAGACAVGGCSAGFADCNKAFNDGCEIATNTDVKNCGGCGTVCPIPNNAQPACALGKCGLGICNANFGNCNGNAGDGCEVNLTNDTKNCGMCAKVCPAGANQTAVCSGSACRTVCNMGFWDCDGNPANGCEVDFSKDPANCSACGMKCTIANGVAGCVAGACTVASCNMGFADCANGAADGCEANTTNDPKNCSKCGMACPNGQQCMASVCSAQRPNVMVCGSTGRPVSQFFPQGQMYASLNGCAPDANTQALFITRNWANGIAANALQTYLTNGGIVLTEYNISYLVWNAAFGTAAAQGARFGGCDDTLPSLVQFTPNDPFWQANAFKPFPNSGCGYSINAYPGITPLSGWDAQNAAIGYRDLGSGRLWATDFDWQDGSPYADGYTAQLMGYMMTHRR